MIPSNILLTQLLPLNELTVQPAIPVDALSDKLSNLIPGQRVLAEIQARLPNGAYRAAIGQRDVTLSLNFAAKPGDTLELQVVENDGHLALAVAGNKQPPTLPPPEGVATNLSKTGQFISALIGKGKDATNQATAMATLNRGQPISNSPTLDAATLAPRLQQAIESSGLFYEAHLARWVFGDNINEQQLRQEPQGQLSNPTIPAKTTTDLAGNKESLPTSPPSNTQPNSPLNPSLTASALEVRDERAEAVLSQTTAANNGVAVATTPPPLVANELTPLVQQQLTSLDNQTLQWQGQLIPGQNVFWEIIKDDEQKSGEDSDGPVSSWRTRLRLQLPELGEIEARLHIQGGNIGLLLEASDALTREKLQAGRGELRNQLAATGLTLTSLGIAPLAPATSDDNRPGHAP